ncbi:MAG: DUF790 family protein [Pseudomonadota bacterium]
MLPQTLLRVSAHLEGDRIVPHYFTARDEPWLRALLAECDRFVGRKRAELHERLRDPLAIRAPKSKLRIAVQVLDACNRARPNVIVPPKEVRAALFRAAAQPHASRDAVLGSVANSFAVTTVELESALFADLPAEQRVAAVPTSFSPERLATDANLAIVAALVRRAAHVQITARGNFRTLIRQARLAGLICRESPLERAADGVALDISGPFALFHHSEVYGRALASLIPRLASCDEFELTAACALGRDGQLSSLALRSGDPIGSGPASAPAEPRLEQKFERDFRRIAPHWDLNRQPPAIASSETLIFPDFELVHRQQPNCRWLLEVLGFWTREYLCEKLQRLHAAGIERFVLCVDQNRDCKKGDLPPDRRIVRYKTRIDPRAILAIITADSAGE